MMGEVGEVVHIQFDTPAEDVFGDIDIKQL